MTNTELLTRLLKYHQDKVLYLLLEFNRDLINTNCIHSTFVHPDGQITITIDLEYYEDIKDNDYKIGRIIDDVNQFKNNKYFKTISDTIINKDGLHLTYQIQTEEFTFKMNSMYDEFAKQVNEII